MSTFSIMRYRRPMFTVGLLFLIVPAVLRTYLLMPFPGSQERNSIAVAYYADSFYLVSVILGALLVLPQVIKAMRTAKIRWRIGTGLLCVLLIGINLLANYGASASRMFRVPTSKIFAGIAANKIPLDHLVIGIEHDGVAKAYPVNMLAYHHRIEDTVGTLPVLVTYCSMCRTGRIYNPIIDGVYEHFRLVGALHYSAVLEDGSTGTWWYQASGEAGYGPRAGKSLEEFPSEQMTLRRWAELHPATLVLQHDPAFADIYGYFTEYDVDRFGTNGRHGEDSARRAVRSAGRFSDQGWVVGVVAGKGARGYDWNDLIAHHIINDAPSNTPIVVALESDSLSFHAWNAMVGSSRLVFALDSAGHGMRDNETNSRWDWSGTCVEGTMIGKRLEPVYARQQYWHSWRTFHPTTDRWEGPIAVR